MVDRYLTECRQSDALNADTIVILLEKAPTVLRVQYLCIAAVQDETKHSRDCQNASISLAETIRVLSIRSHGPYPSMSTIIQKLGNQVFVRTK